MTYEEGRVVAYLFARAEADESGFWDGADSAANIAQQLVLGQTTIERMLGGLYVAGVVEEFQFKTWRLTDSALRDLYRAQATRSLVAA